MPKFSKKSKEIYNTLCPDLQLILDEMIKYFNITLICGYRDRVAQNEALLSGNSTKPWPKSKHNVYPSKAVDVALYPINWKDRGSFILIAGAFLAIGRRLKEQGLITSTPRVGADWNMNDRPDDDKFIDLPHLEVI